MLGGGDGGSGSNNGIFVAFVGAAIADPVGGGGRISTLMHHGTIRG